MTREEQINKFINKFLTNLHGLKHGKDREYLNDTNEASLIKEGVAWADKHPKSPWINYKEEKPPFGVEVIAYHHEWIDEDFNPNGTRIGFLSDDGFTSAFWWDYQDSYLTINKSICEENKDFYVNHIDNTEPEFWMPIPTPPKK